MAPAAPPAPPTIIRVIIMAVNGCAAGRGTCGLRLEAVRGALQRMKGAAQIGRDYTDRHTNTQTHKQT